MTTAADPTPIFADAQFMLAAALERMDAGDIRNASEKAWCAAERAIDALILARCGGLPPESADTTRALLRLAKDNPELAGLRDRYAERRLILYSDCFYTGFCEPVDAIEELIRQTADFIRDAQSLAQA